MAAFESFHIRLPFYHLLKTANLMFAGCTWSEIYREEKTESCTRGEFSAKERHVLEVSTSMPIPAVLLVDTVAHNTVPTSGRDPRGYNGRFRSTLLDITWAGKRKQSSPAIAALTLQGQYDTGEISVAP